MAAPASALKDYLKKYEGSYSDPAPEKKRKKKKKIKNNKIGNVGGIRVVDGDPTWQKPVDEDEEEEEDEMKEAQVTEDIEVKRLKRLEQLRARRPYLALSDDGSGWVSVSDERRDRHKRPDTSADLSPPRNSRRSSPPEDHEDEEALELSEHADLSPPRRHHRPSYEKDDVDLSSPRRSTSALVQTDTVDLSPPRKRSSSLRHDDVDLSPPRKRSSSLHKNSADLSSPRKHSSLFLPHKDVDLSPPRKRGSSSLSHDDVDKSPPRKHESSSSRHNAIDLSPPRKQRLSSSQHVDVDQSPPRKRNYSSISMDKRVDLPPPSKLAFSVKRSEPKDDARRHGLLSKQEMMEEISKKKKEETIRYSEMDPAMTGRAAEPVYRDHGRVISKEEYLKLHAKEEKPKEKKLEWGQGLVQKREAEARLKEITLEKERPFARGSDDPELDKMLKERVRWGDPMAHLVKRKDPDLELEDLGNDEKMKESGFVIPQAVPIHSWLRRGIDPPANRYGIRPGRHWDGVDRSNGFEREMFKRQNEKKATADESYLWSVADM